MIAKIVAARKHVIWLFGGLIMFSAGIVPARAESPREEFNRLVAELQRTPNDNSLRLRIVKQAQTLKPGPEIPEEARRAFIRGNTAMSDAKNTDDYSRAEKHYAEAMNLAPWWSDPVFNEAKARELQQKFAGAYASIKLYLEMDIPTDDVRKAKDYLYVLEEKYIDQVIYSKIMR